MVVPDKNTICYFEGCSLDRALAVAKELEAKVWGFGVYDLILMEGFNAVYQLKKFGRVFADLRIDNENVDYILQCAFAAGADIVSIRKESQRFKSGIASVRDGYEYLLDRGVLRADDKTLQLVPVGDLI